MVKTSKSADILLDSAVLKNQLRSKVISNKSICTVEGKKFSTPTGFVVKEVEANDLYAVGNCVRDGSGKPGAIRNVYCRRHSTNVYGEDLERTARPEGTRPKYYYFFPDKLCL